MVKIEVKSQSVLFEVSRIGVALQTFRKMRKMSQEELCEGICTRGTLSQIENGIIQNPSFGLICNFCDRLNISIDDLLDFSHEKSVISSKRIEKIENMIFREKYREILNAVKILDNQSSKMKLYVDLLGSTFYLYRTNEQVNANALINEYFKNNSNNLRSAENIRMLAIKLRLNIIVNPEDKQSNRADEIELINKMAKYILDLPPRINIRYQILVILLFTDVARLYGLVTLCLKLIKKAWQLIDDNNEVLYRGELLLIEAGIQIEMRNFDEAISNIDDAKKLYELLAIKEKQNYINYLKEIALLSKKLDESEEIIEKDHFDKLIEELGKKYF